MRQNGELRRALLPAVCVSALLAIGPVRAIDLPPGPLDPTFGGDGKVTTAFGPEGTVDTALGMARQPDGKFVLAGNSGGGGSFGSGGSFALARYNPDGTLDQTFNGDGRVTTDLVPEPGSADEAHAVTIQPDGKIVAVGVAEPQDPWTATDFAVVRYNADGTLDPGFGTGGVVLTDLSADFGIDWSNAWAVSLQPDGKIVVAGEMEYSAGFALARYMTDGSLDPAFGDGGTVITRFCSSDLCEPGAAYALVIQPDGKIVAAGIAQVDGGGQFNSFFALARYMPDGSLDPSFGGDGKVTTAFGSGFPDVGAHALIVQPDGKLVAGGYALVDGHLERFGLVRYLADGSLDPTFGGDGKVKTDVSPVHNTSFLQGLTRMADGRIVAAGSAADHDRVDGRGYFHHDLAVVRYNENGSLDTTFGGDGKVTTPVGPDPQYDTARGVVVQPDGRIVVGGYSDMGPSDYYDWDFSLVRYTEDVDPPDTVITKGPSGATRDRTPTFRFRSPDDQSAKWFRCKLDRQRYKWCKSPKTLKKPPTGLSYGRHIFRVKALDQAGNADPTPAKVVFKIVR